MTEAKDKVRNRIQRTVRRTATEFDPDGIILFGSHARGRTGPDSDVDLLVVMPVEGSKKAKQVEIRMALHDVRLPRDIIVSRREEFQWRKDTVGTIEFPATRERETLYARA